MNRTYNNLIALMIVVLTLSIILAITAGCVSISYTSEQGRENLEVKTLFKSLDGLWAERGDDGFSIIIDKTYTHDPARGLAELLGTIDELRGMGLHYDPDWRSPLMPE